MQPQGQVQVLLNLIDRGLNLQEAIDAPRVRALGGLRISVEQTFASELIDGLVSLGHQIIPGEETPADWLQPRNSRAALRAVLRPWPSTRS